MTIFFAGFDTYEIAPFKNLLQVSLHLWRVIAKFAKIATLQGTTFGIKFDYLSHSGYRPPSGDFAPFLPFSPLHAFLEITVFLQIKR